MKYKGKKVFIAMKNEENDWALVSYHKNLKKKFKVKYSELTE